MPKQTYLPLATTTLSSPANSVTFSSIPTTDINGNNLADLVVVALLFKDSGSSSINPFARLNADSTESYFWNFLLGSDSSTSFSTAPIAPGDTKMKLATADSISGNEPFYFETTFFDYTATDKDKIAISQSSSGGFLEVGSSPQRYTGTAAINQIEFFNLSSNQYGAGSTFTIYGIVK